MSLSGRPIHVETRLAPLPGLSRFYRFTGIGDAAPSRREDLLPPAMFELRSGLFLRHLILCSTQQKG